MLRKNHKSLRLAEARRGEVGVQETGRGAVRRWRRRPHIGRVLGSRLRILAEEE